MVMCSSIGLGSPTIWFPKEETGPLSPLTYFPDAVLAHLPNMVILRGRLRLGKGSTLEVCKIKSDMNLSWFYRSYFASQSHKIPDPKMSHKNIVIIG